MLEEDLLQADLVMAPQLCYIADSVPAENEKLSAPTAFVSELPNKHMKGAADAKCKGSETLAGAYSRIIHYQTPHNNDV